MQKRIYGIETEYGIIFTPDGRKTLPVEKAIRFLFEKLITNIVDRTLGPEAYEPKPGEDEGFFGRLKSALR